MKYFILTSLLITSTVFACPELAGKYECKKNREISNRIIEKTSNGFLITTDHSSSEYYTDGTTQTLPDNDSIKNGRVTSHCEQNKLIIDFKVTIMYEGSEIARQISKTTYEIQDGILNITQKIKMKGVPLPTIKEKCILL